MRTVKDIAELLPELDERIADTLEAQDLDFKQWNSQSRDKAVQLLVRMAICMANGGGGTVVFGVADQLIGRQQALLGVVSIKMSIGCSLMLDRALVSNRAPLRTDIQACNHWKKI